MSATRKCCSTWGLILWTGLLLFADQGCHSRTSKNRDHARQTAAQSNTEPELLGADYCVQTMMQKAVAVPVHISYKINNSDGSFKDYEGDLSADTVDLVAHEQYHADPAVLRNIPNAPPVRNGLAETVSTNHYKRSDAAAWNFASSMMAQNSTPWHEFIAKPPSTRVGVEDVNGFSTIKYAVDTRNQSQIDKSGAIAGWGVKDYNITGYAWVTKDTGCILQYAIDSEREERDGKMSKTHYEGTVTRR